MQAEKYSFKQAPKRILVIDHCFNLMTLVTSTTRGMHSSTNVQAPFNVVDFLWSCDKLVYHKQEVCFLLYFLGQIVTWRYNSNLLDYNWPCTVIILINDHDWQLQNCLFPVYTRLFLCPRVDAHRALELLEDYHSRLTKPQDKPLKNAIERVIRIFKSRLFQALLGTYGLESCKGQLTALF